jgi:hypothetical protein
MDVIMHVRFKRINAVGPFEMEIPSFQEAEETFTCRVVESVAFASHALLDSASRKHRTVGLHWASPGFPDTSNDMMCLGGR